MLEWSCSLTTGWDRGMDEKYYVGRMLETENLTDNLEDADAEQLLAWGIRRVRGLLGDPALADERITALMAVLRKINRIAPAAGVRPPEELVADLADLAQANRRAFGSAPNAEPDDLRQLAGSLAGQPVSESLHTLLNWLAME